MTRLTRRFIARSRNRGNAGILTAVFLVVLTAAATASAGQPPTLLFLGDSITAGFGVDPEEAYPALIQKTLDQQGIDVTVINGSISGSTTASALSRLKWYARAAPDILILALGANDGLRGLSTKDMEQNLDTAIAAASDFGMTVVLAGMEVPPNLGPDYSKDFRQVFRSLAEKHDLVLIPFLLEGVGGEPDLNQADGIHPNADGHKVIARTVLDYIKDVL